MSERIVALEREGVLRLYSVNGDGPHEVGSLTVGRIDEHHGAMLAAAFMDLHGVAHTAQLPKPGPSYFDQPTTTYVPEAPARPALPKPKANRGGRGHPDPTSLNGRIRAYLVEHGPSTATVLLAGTGVEATPTKTATQRLGTALSTLKRAGQVKRTGKVWSLSGKGAPLPERKPPTTPERAGRPVFAATEAAAARLLAVIERYPEGVGGLQLSTLANVQNTHQRLNALRLLVERGQVIREGDRATAAWRPAHGPEPEAEPVRAHALETYL